MKIDLPYQTQHRLVNIVRTVARKSSNRLKFCWLKVICYICQSNVDLSTKLGVRQKSGGHGPPSPPLRTATAGNHIEL